MPSTVNASHFPVDRAWYRRRRDQRQTGDLALGLPARVTDLGDRAGAFALDGVGQPREPRKISILVPHHHPRHHATAGMNADILGDDQAEPTPRPRRQVVAQPVADTAVRLGEIGGNAGHDHAISQGLRAEPERAEQMRKRRRRARWNRTGHLRDPRLRKAAIRCL
jgi:hypothetical protein